MEPNTPQGLEEWFLAMYEKEADTLFRFALFKLRDREAAVDAVQDTFTRMWEYAASGRTIANFRAFAFTTARRRIADTIRRARPLYAHELGESAEWLLEPGAPGDAEETAELSRVMACMKGLSEEDRELVFLRYTEGVPVKELAEALGEKANTVTVRLKRAIEALRVCLGAAPAVKRP